MELYNLEGPKIITDFGSVGRGRQNLAELYNKCQVAVTKSSTYLKTIIIYYKLYNLAWTKVGFLKSGKLYV